MKYINFLPLAAAALLLASCNKQKEYDATGAFEATEVTISSESQGRLLFLNVEEGSNVNEGDLVAVTDTTQLWLKALELGASQQSLKWQKPNTQIQIAVLKQQIATAEREKQRIVRLLKDGAANAKQLDDYNEQLALLHRQVDAQLSSMNKSSESLNQQGSSVDLERRQVIDQLNKCHIVCPVSGTVLDKYAQAGELATQGRPLFKMADMNKVYLRAYITSEQLRNVRLGMPVTVYADYGNNKRKTYKGTVTYIASQSEFTPKTIQTDDERANLVYAIKVSVKNDGYIKLGMYGEVKLK
jgi:HlyD family secretion protein